MKSGASGNDARVSQWLQKILDTFDLTLPGDNGSFGEDLMDTFSLGVREQTVGNQLQPDGAELAPNRGLYAEIKENMGLPVGVGIKPDSIERMLSLTQLKGERTVTADQASMIYGVTSFARDKANWFTNGAQGGDGEPSGAEGQPPRPFWDFNEILELEIVDLCEARINKVLSEIG